MIHDLGRATWPETDGRPLLLVPVGSVEQHGPALSLATDTIIAEAVTREAAALLRAVGRPVLVAPAVAYGASGEHEDFAGTVSIGHRALGGVLVELGRSAARWASGVVFVNGHGGNASTVASAVDLLRTEGRAASWAACAAPGSDAHAGLTETSLLLHLAPETVRVDLLEPGDTRPVTELMPALRSQGVRAMSANGVLGDPTGASAEEGRRVLGVMVDRVVAEVGG
jgi:mycofactocin precursor peptide peptidase